ncbi:potassium channel family protein [Streptacidiphilus jiangxiensis]|uniref:Ion channel n=1 Tax=Streptacidiphilus jiangxiensis TaxID=235985 RepID=A0A1H7TNI8_STRJI|nr:potassium channel family protein [Streptacidiphilus jiangxiensis]SEL86024.1 Ion channel [Streptacidiphilus jiangxiensis]
MDASGGAPEPGQAPARLTSGRIAWMVVRVAGTIFALGTLYYLLPLDHSSTQFAITTLVIGLVGFVALVAAQVRIIVRSRRPTARAVQALATSVSFFLLLFASTYVVLAALSPANFGGPLSHSDGLYFTVTVFATVGFGDITAKSELARSVVTGQMLADLAVLGLAVRITVDAARRGGQRQARAQQGRSEPEPPQ